MLSQEQFILMSWLLEQPGPVTLQQMADLQAPGFTEYRVEELKEQGLLRWEYVSYNGNLLPGYFVSDKGKAALEAMKEVRRKEAEDKRQQRFPNQISVAQVLVPLVTFVLGLVVEHYAGLVSGLAELLGRWVK